MTTKNRPDPQDEAIARDFQELAPVEIVEPTPPHGISDAERQGLAKRAEELIGELAQASGTREMDLADSVTQVGTQVQRNSGAEFDLLRARVADMMTQGGAGAEISSNLIELRTTLNRINPKELSQPGIIGKVLAVLPFVGAAAPALKVLQKIAIRYEPVSRQISMIETKLREGRMMLTKDNVELRQLYEGVEAQQLPIQKNAYLGELLMGELQKLLDKADDSIKAERVRNALHDVAMRVQDLRTMEQVYTQFFVSIDMTRQNNNRLGQAVERTLSVATNTLMVGLAIQSALTRQRQIMEATQRTREFIGDLLVANAASIKQHTEEIGDVYNNPVIAMDMITQAHADLMEAMTTADRLRQEGISSAQVNIAKLSQMSAEMKERAAALPAPEAKEPKSLEA